MRTYTELLRHRNQLDWVVGLAAGVVGAAGLSGELEAGVSAGFGAAGAATAALPPRILNMTTPQVGHLPLIALRPFFMVSSTASAISFLALHLTQYPSGIKMVWAGASGDMPQFLEVTGGRPTASTFKRLMVHNMLMFKQIKHAIAGKKRPANGQAEANGAPRGVGRRRAFGADGS